MQLPKLKKLVNAANPGSHFMKMTTYDAREVLTPGSPYLRSSIGTTHSIPSYAAYGTNPYLRPHDRMSFISPEQIQAATAMPNLHVPLGMFMKMNPLAPRFYNQPQSISRETAQNPRKSGLKKRTYKDTSDNGSQLTAATQDLSNAPLSQSEMSQTGPLTQGDLPSISQTQYPSMSQTNYGLSQAGMSQPGLSQPGLSQPGLSQPGMSNQRFF